MREEAAGTVRDRVPGEGGRLPTLRGPALQPQLRGKLRRDRHKRQGRWTLAAQDNEWATSQMGSSSGLEMGDKSRWAATLE